MTNKYEFRARAEKVEKLVNAFVSVGIPADKARLMTDTEWMTVCKTLGMRPPSEATKQAVYEALDYRNAPKTMTVREWKNALDDPFARFA